MYLAKFMDGNVCFEWILSVLGAAVDLGTTNLLVSTSEFFIKYGSFFR